MRRHLTTVLVIIVLMGLAAYGISLLPGRPIDEPWDAPLAEDDRDLEGEVNSIGEDLELPDPTTDGMDVERALKERRSVRQYTDEPLQLREVGQLLWAAAGITDERGFRTAPSAGATYPLEVYLVVGSVRGLSEGVYRYDPRRHRLSEVDEEDRRDELYQAGLRQDPIREAPVVLVISGVYERTTARYGDRGERYVHMEAGHAAQNIYLQATSLNLGTVVIGAFDDDSIASIMRMGEGESPLYLIPVGRPES